MVDILEKLKELKDKTPDLQQKYNEFKESPMDFIFNYNDPSDYSIFRQYVLYFYQSYCMEKGEKEENAILSFFKLQLQKKDFGLDKEGQNDLKRELNKIFMYNSDERRAYFVFLRE